MLRHSRFRSPAHAESVLLDLLALAVAPLPEVRLAAMMERATDMRHVDVSVGTMLNHLVVRGLVRHSTQGYEILREPADQRLLQLHEDELWHLEAVVDSMAPSTPETRAIRRLRRAISQGDWEAVTDLSQESPRPAIELLGRLGGLVCLDTAPPWAREELLEELGRHLVDSGTDISVGEWLDRQGSEHARSIRVERAILRGRLQEARELCADDGERTPPAWWALVLAAEGRHEEAREAALRHVGAVSPREGRLASSLVPLLLLENWPERAADVLHDARDPAADQVLWLARWRARQIEDAPRDPGDPGWPSLVYALALYWTGHPDRPRALPGLERAAAHCRQNGLPWLAEQMEMALQGRPEGLAALLSPTENWRRVLHGLRRLVEPARTPERLVWAVRPDHRFALLEPRLQKRTKRGDWTAGRHVEWHDIPGLACATQQDRQAVRARWEDWEYGTGRWGEALSALVGHPCLVHATTGLPLQLVERRAGVQVVHRDGHLHVAPLEELRDEDFVLQQETPQRLVLYRMNPVHRELARTLGAGVDLPMALEDELKSLLAGLADRMPVHSDVVLEGQPVQPADPTPCVLLFPEGQGLRALVRVRVLDAFLRPGSGTPIVAGQNVQVQRDLQEERRRCDALLAECPALVAEVAAGPEEALELLEGLAGRPEEILWPEGGKLQVQRTVRSEDLRLRVRSDQDWFCLEAEEDGGLPGLPRLLEHMQSSRSRFIPLGEGRFLALSEQLRRMLEDVADLASVRGSSLQVHPVAGLGLALPGDAGWEARVAAMHRAQATAPELPAGLRAELREYQVEGYRWLARMAAWAGGACLADDMGLGKTVQSLALLLQRADDGPALVVAPTSVCPNWAKEAARFAPGLRVVPFDTIRALSGLGAGHLVIASYGLLVSEVERLAQVPWSTLLLDEAQAIKNPATRRFQAAVRLGARFRLATTGTPVENRLDELWALFRFLAPGLLGSRERFKERFAAPIERNGDPEARERLQRLVRPFLLRRTKEQVLPELPPRTEVEILVEPLPQEKALYESLRRQAVERLGQVGEEGRFHVLAELMRLRRAACHPRLVAPERDLRSGKHEVLARMLEELRSEGHRVLVFSQFVDHLALVREHLDAKGISYQYLDGSTSAGERARRVQAFQAGEGEVFLISLRAGGTGLNLTGADYVIHMDPWWNPAVEDQASDRAHRLGQTRPVTIYRLVARGSIEEKILRLHADKRQLAEGVLAGADTPGAVPVEELLRLLREG